MLPDFFHSYSGNGNLILLSLTIFPMLQLTNNTPREETATAAFPEWHLPDCPLWASGSNLQLGYYVVYSILGLLMDFIADPTL